MLTRNHYKPWIPRAYIFVFMVIQSNFAAAAESNYETYPLRINTESFRPPTTANGLEADILRSAKYMNERTESQCQRAESQASLSFNIFRDEPNLLTKEEADLLEPLYDEVFHNTDIYVHEIKRKWDRLRPFQGEIRIKNIEYKIEKCIRSHSSSSYISGHSAIGRAAANIFSVLLPNKAEALRALGNDIGENRILAGVHYLSDVEDGRKMGDIVVRELLKSPAFRKKLDDLKEKLKRL
ncbi:MAG: phosphatase PAP2 family protein [Bdellovibrionaceae bacterium]|nr:phosphatase PAP2 family protein [Pseudobdellovibrionaceae bacterium]